jgi:alkyl sulfatase BDS1-like metallo-beta-lactamase superfamily hydrolase
MRRGSPAAAAARGRKGRVTDRLRRRMTGSAKILARGRGLIDQGRYLHATELLNRFVFAQPQNMDARRLLAEAFEQLGCQAESTSVRNTFLQGAYELLNGLPGGCCHARAAPTSCGPCRPNSGSTSSASAWT